MADDDPYADADPYANAGADKYRKAALEDLARSQTAGAPAPGYADRAARAVGQGWTERIIAGASTPIEMVRRGVGLGEAYNYAKAAQDLQTEQINKATSGAGGVAADVIGSAVAPGQLAKAGVTLAGKGANALTRAGLLGAEGAAYGAVNAAGQAPTIADMPKEALKGGGMGAVLGGVVAPAASAALPVIAKPFSYFAPQREAASQVLRAAKGQNLDDVIQRVQDASAAGQTGYTVADALGLSGQRKLASVAKLPGEAREQISQVLAERQAGTPNRLRGATEEALGIQGGETAQEAAVRLTDQARRESRPFYKAAEQHGTMWDDRLAQFYENPVIRKGLAEGEKIQRLNALAENRPYNPRDYAITDFDASGAPTIGGVPNMKTVQTIKTGLDNILEGYRDKTTGRLVLDEYGRAIDNVRRSFLREVDQLNPAYGFARAVYSGPAQAREAIGAGQQAVTSGRSEDILRRFEGMQPHQQQGFRVGYGDKLAEQIERGQPGRIPASMVSPKGQRELSELSLYQGPVRPGEGDQLRKFIQREQDMQRTAQHARGGSSTAENIADITDTIASGLPPVASIGQQLISGHPFRAASSALSLGAGKLAGSTEPVRNEIARLLLSRGDDAGQLRQLARQLQELDRSRRARAALAGSTLAGASQ